MGEIAEVQTAEPVDFLLLGPLEVRTGGAVVPVGAARERRMLAGVLYGHPHPVSRGRLMTAVWDDVEVKDPAAAFDKVAMQLRRGLEAAGLRGVLRAEPGGYRLGLPGARVDADRFHLLVAEARRWAGVDPRKAAELFEAALGEFRGRPLEGLEGRWIDGVRHILEEERYAAEVSFHETVLRLGRHTESIPRLEALLLERPDDEGLTWMAMHAYYRAGRQPDAQKAFHRLRRELGDRVGIETRRFLTELYQRMLEGDPSLDEPSALDFPFGSPVRAAIAGPAPAAAGPEGSEGSQDPERSGNSGSSEDSEPQHDRSTFTQTNSGETVNAVQGGSGEQRYITTKNYAEFQGSVDRVHIGDVHHGPGSETPRA